MHSTKRNAGLLKLAQKTKCHVRILERAEKFAARSSAIGRNALQLRFALCQSRERDLPPMPSHVLSGTQGTRFEHQVIDHAERYVDGRFHTTDLKTFGSLPSADSRKLTERGRVHLFRYLDEQCSV